MPQVSIADSLTSSFQPLIEEITAILFSLLPIALGVIAVIMAIGFGIKVFTRIIEQRERDLNATYYDLGMVMGSMGEPEDITYDEADYFMHFKSQGFSERETRREFKKLGLDIEELDDVHYTRLGDNWEDISYDLNIRDIDEMSYDDF